MVVIVICLFLMVPLVGLQFVILVFPGHAHLLFYLLRQTSTGQLVLKFQNTNNNQDKSQAHMSY